MDTNPVDPAKNLLIIDTDCGVDDAVAIMMALSFPETWEVVAITCCFGNTTVDNVCNNVLRVLHLCGRTDIPVYRGCSSPLLPRQPPLSFFSEDGLGSAAHEYATGPQEIFDEHAVNALVKLVRTHSGNLHLLALGPLTNVAMAHRMDSQFTANLKSLVFMGGNIHGVGNTTSAAEYNFACDPESAHVIVSEVQCPTIMVPWETTLNHGLPWYFYYQWTARNEPIARFIKRITLEIVELRQNKQASDILLCDAIAAAVLLDPSCLLSSTTHQVSVETSGTHTRGQAVIGRLFKHVKCSSIQIAMTFDNSRLFDMYNKITQTELLCSFAPCNKE